MPGVLQQLLGRHPAFHAQHPVLLIVFIPYVQYTISSPVAFKLIDGLESHRPNKKSGPHVAMQPAEPGLRFLRNRVNAHFFLVAAKTLEAYDAVNFCEKGIVTAAADILARVDFRPALAVQDGTAGNELAVRTLCAEALRFGVTAVLRGTYTFFRCEKLEIQT